MVLLKYCSYNVISAVCVVVRKRRRDYVMPLLAFLLRAELLNVFIHLHNHVR